MKAFLTLALAAVLWGCAAQTECSPPLQPALADTYHDGCQVKWDPDNPTGFAATPVPAAH